MDTTLRRSTRGHTDLHLWLGPEGLQGGAWRDGAWLAAWTGSAPMAPAEADADAAVTSPDARHAPLVQAVQALATRWASLAADPAAGRLRLWVTVADVHLHTATLAWTPLSMRDALLPSLAQAQLLQAGHEVSARDVLRVGEGGAGQPRWLVAYPEALMAACEALAQSVGAALVSVLPLSVQAWEAVQPWRQAGGEAAVLGVAVDGMAVLLDGARQPMHGHALRHSQPLAALRGQWRRRQLRRWAVPASGASLGAAAQVDEVLASGLPGTPAQGDAARLPVLDLRSEAGVHPAQDASFTWVTLPERAPEPSRQPSRLLGWLQARTMASAHALDAVQRPPAPARGWWLACAALWVVAVLLCLDNWSVWQDRRVAQAAAPRSTASDTVRVAAAPAFTREELGQVQQVNEAVRRLNLPIDALLEGLRPPQDIRVAVLSVDVRAGGTGGRGLGLVRAQAEEGVDMARYVAFVAGRTPFSDALLKQHERREDEPGRPYLFTMEATWPQ